MITFTNGNRLISRYNASGNFVEEVLTISGIDGITVLQDDTGFTISGSQGTISGVLQADINSRVLRSGDTMTGPLSLSGTPSADQHAATKIYVDSAVSGVAASAAIQIQDDGVTELTSAKYVDFGHALDVTPGVSGVLVDVNEAGLTSVVFLTGDQVISGNKTFADSVSIAGDLTVLGTTTTLNTEELLVEDNIITLNSTFSGVPTIINAGIEVERGDEDNAQLLWDETNDYFVAGTSGSLSKIILASDISGISGSLQTDINSRVLRSGDTMTGDLTLFADPTASGHAANKFYVDQGDIAVSGAFVAADAVVTAAYIAADAVVTSGYIAADEVVTAAYIAADAVVTSGYIAADLALSGVLMDYIDGAVSGATIEVQDQGVTDVATANVLNFSTGLSVSGAGNTAHITINEAAFTNVVFLTGNQTIAGVKSFTSPVVLASGVEPALISSTGTSGEVRWADDYLYVCVATDSWKRVALAQF